MAETWRDIKGYSGTYQVSDTGKVKSLSRVVFHKRGKLIIPEKIRKTTKNNKGYVLITLCQNSTPKTFLLHRIVAETFLPNPFNKPQVNHKDWNKGNNHKDNLVWSTVSENIKYDFDNGYRDATGENHPQSVLSDKDIVCLRIINKSKLLNQRELGELFYTVQSNVCKIVNNQRR